MNSIKIFLITWLKKKKKKYIIKRFKLIIDKIKPKTNNKKRKNWSSHDRMLDPFGWAFRHSRDSHSGIIWPEELWERMSRSKWKKLGKKYRGIRTRARMRTRRRRKRKRIRRTRMFKEIATTAHSVSVHGVHRADDLDSRVIGRQFSRDRDSSETERIVLWTPTTGPYNPTRRETTWDRWIRKEEYIYIYAGFILGPLLIQVPTSFMLARPRNFLFISSTFVTLSPTCPTRRVSDLPLAYASCSSHNTHAPSPSPSPSPSLFPSPAPYPYPYPFLLMYTLFIRPTLTLTNKSSRETFKSCVKLTVEKNLILNFKNFHVLIYAQYNISCTHYI